MDILTEFYKPSSVGVEKYNTFHFPGGSPDMNLRFAHRRLLLIATLPALIGLPVLVAPLPLANSHGLREIAAYFQSLALLRTGFESYMFITPFESRSALHLHSLLSIPLLALGYVEAGRLVSLVSAIVGAYLVGLIAKKLHSTEAAVFAVGALWLQPLYIRFAVRWWPEALSIALTVFAVYATLEYLDSNDRRWFLAVLVTLLVAPTNHMWEAAIAFPIFALLASEREYLAAGLTGIVTAASIALVWLGTSLQPAGASSITHFGVHNDPSILLSLAWWSRMPSIATHPVSIEGTLLLPLGIVLTAAFSVRAARQRERVDILLATWFASGIVVPLLLPFGAENHVYYLWNLIAPAAIFTGLLIPSLIEYAPSHIPRYRLEQGTVVAFLFLAITSGLVFEAGVFEAIGAPEAAAQEIDGDIHSQIDGFGYGELEAAGREVSASTATSANQVAFLGDWGPEEAGGPWTPEDRMSTFGRYRVLIYSGLMVSPAGEDQPQLNPEQSENEAKICAVRNETVTVREC